MTGIPMKTQQGQRGYYVVETVRAGQVVEGRTGGIGVAGAGSMTWVGVAIADGLANPNGVGSNSLYATASADAFGRSTLLAAPNTDQVTVVSAGHEVPVVFAAAATFGQWLIAAAGGQVTPAGAGADPRTLVGKCVAPTGVAQGATGLMRVL